MRNYQNHEQEYHLIPGSLSATLLMCCIRCQDFLHIHVHQDLYDLVVLDCIKFKLFVMLLCHMRSSFSMPLLYHAYVYLEFLILACTIYILAPNATRCATETGLRLNTSTNISKSYDISWMSTESLIRKNTK